MDNNFFKYANNFEIGTKDNMPEPIDLKRYIFDYDYRADIINMVINWQMAKRRSGCHKTKNVSEVSGTTAKPHRQKGTGKARQGSLRSTQFRGGGIPFGPVVRSHDFKLNKKFRKVALRSAVSYKVREKEVCFTGGIDFDIHKTQDAEKFFSAFTKKSYVLIIAESANEGFLKAIRNIRNINFLPICGLNVLDIIRSKFIFIDKNCLELLENRMINDQ